MSTERSEQGAALAALQAGRAVAIIGGEAGIGKTHLARSLAPPDVTQISGTHPATLTLSIAALAVALGLPEGGGEGGGMDHGAAVRAVRGALAADPGRIPGGMLLFDDVRDPEAILPYLIPGVRILITSPVSVFSGVATSVALAPLNVAHSRRFLADLMGEGAPGVALAPLLGGEPLALTLAAGLLGLGLWDVSALEDALRHEGAGADAPTPKGAPPEILGGIPTDMAAWLEHHVALAQQQGARSGSPEQPSPATRALVGLALRACEGELRSWLARRALQGPSRPPGALSKAPRVKGKQARILALLVSPSGEMHGALQGAILGFLSDAERAEAVAAAAEIWSRAFDATPEGAPPARRDALLPALLHLTDRAGERGISPEGLLSAQASAGRWLSARGLQMDAQVLLEGALRALEQRGQETALRGGIHRDLSRIFRALGQNNEAEYQLEEAMRWLERSLGPDHPDVAAINAERVALLQTQFQALQLGMRDLP